jgi:hypothetical protein
VPHPAPLWLVSGDALDARNGTTMAETMWQSSSAHRELLTSCSQ